jgi:cytochrome c biogenesis protein
LCDVVATAKSNDDDANKAPDPTIRTTGRTKEEEDQAFKEFLIRDMKQTFKKALKQVSSLPLAISEFGAIAGFSALGTVIEQNKSYAWYVENYPVSEDAPLFGALDFTFILNNGLDHVYTTWYFLSLLSLLAVSLAACTATKQLPVWRVAAKWKFIKKPKFLVSSKTMDERESVKDARAMDLANSLADRGYQVFLREEDQEQYLYAFKGLIGRLAPIGVHFALLLTLGGCAYSGLGGLGGSVMAPKDTSFTISDGLTRGSPLSRVPKFAKTNQVFVKDFTIDYLPSGQVSQFYSNLSILDEKGNEVDNKVISVNVPLRYGGVTMYQTDWSMSSMRVTVITKAAAEDTTNSDNSESGSSSSSSSSSSISSTSGTISDGDESSKREELVLPMANLENKGDFKGKIWGTFLPVSDDADAKENKKGISLVARDFQSVAIYDSKGAFVGVRRPSSKKPIDVDNISLIVEEISGATGLELKTDPGVPFVYAGFAGLLVTSFLSLLSHSQVWGAQKKVDGTSVLYVGGTSNRGKEEFRLEFDQVLDELPEYV